MSWMPFNPSSSNVPSCSCSLIRRPPCLTLCWFEEVSWSNGSGFLGRWIACWASNPKAGFFCRWMMPLHGIGKLKPGGGLAGRFSTTSSSRRQCWWWGRIWFISLTDSFYKLCQLSALSASILRLPEQTKTGATEAFSGLQTARADRNWCHSGERRLAAGLARGGISNILPQ